MQPADELAKLEPIRDSLELIEPPDHNSMLFGVAAALIVLSALALWFGIRWFLRRRRARLVSPERLASERLWRIEPDAIPARELFRELHPILVEYLTARAGLPAAKLTSLEILSSFDAARFGKNDDLQAFLEHSDRARFSQVSQSA